jgi:hypothetical protein
MGRRERGEGGFPKTDATTILADEQKGVFRVLDIGRPRPAGILLSLTFFCMRLPVFRIRNWESGSREAKIVFKKSK